MNLKVESIITSIFYWNYCFGDIVRVSRMELWNSGMLEDWVSKAGKDLI
ncbi:hypothetical protein D1AOALGA4SA_12339 [Olavius algarvensis Delta 1 endosymbiont]|nr:hypothetical protein D1AOALGA4SA_12339 [Olavius algarvensis Delta 1 endosymbiont]